MFPENWQDWPHIESNFEELKWNDFVSVDSVAMSSSIMEWKDMETNM